MSISMLSASSLRKQVYHCKTFSTSVRPLLMNSTTKLSNTASTFQLQSQTAKMTSSADLPSISQPAKKLSAAEEYAWNAPSKGMARFHNSHKRTFLASYEHAEDYESQGLSLSSFLRDSYNLVIHLGNHHAIEESYIFPLLARKHPAFRPGAEHKEAHAAIHDGLERYSEFLRSSMRDQSKYSAKELRAILDSFREPLMTHLDQEVRDLEPESLRAHGFTLSEVRALPF